MAKFTAILCIIFLYIGSAFSQNKEILKIEKLFNSGSYEKCILKASEYVNTDKKEPGPFYYLAISYFRQYHEFKDNVSIKLASKNLYKGMQLENSASYNQKFASEIDSLHVLLKQFAYNYYEAEKSEAKTYYDYLAKIYNDTLAQYNEVVLNQKSRPDAEIIEMTLKGEINQTDDKGLKQGKWMKVYANGVTAYEAYFKDDKPINELKRYHENGKLSSFVKYTENIDTALAEFYDEDGVKISEGKYIGKAKTGIWIYYNNTIKIREESYENDIYNGFQIVYYDNGQIYDRKKFENGVEVGLWEKFHKNGNPFLKAMFKNGVLNGPILRYYPSGKIEVKGQYVNDMKEGKWYFYSEDGQSEVIEYIKGEDVNGDKVDKIKSDEYRNNIEKGKTITDPEKYKNRPEEYPYTD
jgi:antitoxin component YwqK of YwqJK toxin-antitoxin module